MCNEHVLAERLLSEDADRQEARAQHKGSGPGVASQYVVFVKLCGSMEFFLSLAFSVLMAHSCSSDVIIDNFCISLFLQQFNFFSYLKWNTLPQFF